MFSRLKKNKNSRDFLVDVYGFNSPSHPGRVSLTVPALRIVSGRTYGVIGLSGSGKSVLFSLLMGYPAFPIHGGLACERFSVFGEDFHPSDFRNNSRFRERFNQILAGGTIVYLPQLLPRQNLYRVSTGVVMCSVFSAMIGRRTDIQVLRKQFDKYGMTREFDKPFSALSGGERRRVELIVRICAVEKQRKPCILLLDEPTTGFDPLRAQMFAKEIRAEVKRLAAEEVPIAAVVSTHNLEFADTTNGVFDELVCVHRDLCGEKEMFDPERCYVVGQGKAIDLVEKLSKRTPEGETKLDREFLSRLLFLPSKTWVLALQGDSHAD